MAQTRTYPTGPAGTATEANTGADSVVASGGTATIDNQSPLLYSGGFYVLMTGTTTSGSLYLQRNVTVSGGLAIDLDLYLTQAVTAETYLAGLFNGASRQIGVALTVDRFIRLRDGASANAWTSTYAIPLNTHVRVALFGTQDASAGTMRAAIFLGVGTTPVSGGDSGMLTGRNTGSSAYNSIRVGVKASTATTTPIARISSYAIDPSASDLTTPGGSNNVAPVANAGANRTNIEPGTLVTVGGTDTDSDGTIASRAWTQLSGPTVALSSTTAAAATFVAPPTKDGGAVVLRKTVTDNGGAITTADVTVGVLPASRWTRGTSAMQPSYRMVT